MSDPAHSDADALRAAKSSNKSLVNRLLARLRRPDPEDRDAIMGVLDTAHEREVLDAESFRIIKGALAFAEQTVGDIMVPRSRMDMLDIAQPLSVLLPRIMETAHSRFPVYENARDNVVGVLLAKDLLRCLIEPNIALRALVRSAVFIPPSKRLDVLLGEFRSSRNHQAIVIDEHGGICGLVTMEDVLEQIVGAIDDEYDQDDKDAIVTESENQWRVVASTEIEHFNEVFHTQIPDDNYDSIGGWLGGELDRIPRRGDHAVHGDLRIDVMRADARRALWLRVRRLPLAANATSASPT
jgi:magnesium and cobalt transporter